MKDECNAADGRFPTASKANEKPMKSTTMDMEGYYSEVKEVALEGFKRLRYMWCGERSWKRPPSHASDLL
jgi:hypothetical protein